MFCQYMRKAGIITYYCPWIKLNHTGSYVFGGSLLDLAQLGASATADPTEVAKMKKKPKKMAGGGMVARGTGAAIRGKGFKGVF